MRLQRGPGWIPGITAIVQQGLLQVRHASKRPRLDTGDYATAAAVSPLGSRPLQRGPGWIPGITRRCIGCLRPLLCWLQRGPGWIPGITGGRSVVSRDERPASKRPRLDTGDYVAYASYRA